MSDAVKVLGRLRECALRFPGAYEDFPWGESVVKVNKKIFVFLGVADSEKYPPGVGLKLRESNELALAAAGVEPSGYGLGKAGWVSVSLIGDHPPEEIMLDWIDESYRLVAPKRLIAELDARHLPPKG